MKILLHVCCAPCTTYPLTVLREAGHQVEGFFFNPNIHPYQEFNRRLQALEELCAKTNFPVCFDREYGLKEYLRQVVFHETNRCAICYAMRLIPTVQKALATKADAFSTTLLYSRYQNHQLIKTQAENLARQFGLAFFYEDFREGWQQGIELAKELALYRQPYCGCIYSEQERYDKGLRSKSDPAISSKG